MPTVVRRINNALLRADQIEYSEGMQSVQDWLVPIVADAEAGFGGPLNAYELMKSMIARRRRRACTGKTSWRVRRSAATWAARSSSPPPQHVRTLNAARLAADVAGVPSVIVARTDAEAATLITSDVDERDQPFLTGDRTAEGFYKVRNGIEPCIARGLAYAPYADLIWMETGTPDLELAKKFAEGIKAEFPDQMLAYNCSPSFNWRKHLDDATIAKFQRELGAMGFKFQFITLAGFHALNYSMFDLAHGYARNGMSAYVDLQETRIRLRRPRLHRHQAPARSGHRLLRPGRHRAEPQQRHPRPGRLHRSPAVPLTPRAPQHPTPLPSSERSVPDTAPYRARSAHSIPKKEKIPMNSTNSLHGITLNGITLTAQPIRRQQRGPHPRRPGLRCGPAPGDGGAARRNCCRPARTQRRQIANGTDPRFLPRDRRPSAKTRTGGSPPRPPGLEDRRVEITGPVDKKMTINALNSGAKVWLADMEDSSTPTWRNVIQGQLNLTDALERRIDFTSPEGKEYQLRAGRGPAHHRGPAPRLAPAGEAHAHRRAAPSPAASWTSACTSSTTPAA